MSGLILECTMKVGIKTFLVVMKPDPRTMEMGIPLYQIWFHIFYQKCPKVVTGRLLVKFWSPESIIIIIIIIDVMIMLTKEYFF